MNRITKLLGIKFPIIQAGMIWCAPWELAAAVSNAGGLGIIGSASMYPETLRVHVKKCQKATNRPFGVNVVLMYPDIEVIMDILIEEGVKIIFTSAGNPKLWTRKLQDHGITVVHVVSSTKFAQKAVDAGVDAIVAEGFEAGGHNGRDETTTMCLIPMVRKAVDVPLIAAGGIGTGRGMLAAMSLGAEGVQIGSRFAASTESSAHNNFKQSIVEAGEGDTVLTLKELTPVRLIRNPFFEQVKAAQESCATKEDLQQLLGRARAKRGMFEGDLIEGELEIGQISSQIDTVKSAAQIVSELVVEYEQARQELAGDAFKLEG